MKSKKSKTKAHEMLQQYVETVISTESKHIIAICLVGSLSNGSFVPSPGSDIDQITIVKENTPKRVYRLLHKYLNDIEESNDKVFRFARTIFSIRQLNRPFKMNFELNKENMHLLEVTTELQRLHESGVILYGDENIITKLPIPTREEIIEFHKLSRRFSEKMQEKYPNEIKPLSELPVRISVQVLLTSAFKHYYYATGKSCSNKFKIASLIKEEIDEYLFQEGLDLATKLKKDPKQKLTPEETVVVRSSAEQLKEWSKNNPVDAVPLKSHNDLV
jgi:predicted nucleotidyltransferase